MKRFWVQLNFLIMLIGVSFVVIDLGYVLFIGLGFGLIGFTLIDAIMLYGLFVLIYRAFKKSKTKDFQHIRESPPPSKHEE